MQKEGDRKCHPPFVSCYRLLADNLDFENALALANQIPVDEINEAEVTEAELAFVNHEGLAAAKEAAAQVSVGIEAAALHLTGMCKCKLDMFGTRMQVLTFVTAGGDELLHDIDKILLKELTVEISNVMRALLNHYRAGGVVGIKHADTVLDAALGNNLLNLFGYIVEIGHVVLGLDCYFTFENFHFTKSLIVN